MHCDVYFFLSVSKKNDDDIIMNQNIISFKMFIRNIFSDGMLSAIICIPLILAAIYRFVFPLIVQHYPMLKDFSLYYPILDLFLAIMCPYMICFASALVVLDETDMKINRYITITPLGKKGYLISRLLIPVLFVKNVVQDLTSAGIDWQREKWQSGLGSKFIHQGEKNAAKYADEVIVLSKGVQDYFKETYGRETHFIPNGVNRPQIREASLITDKFGLKKDSYILFLGRLVPEKGIRYLVEAFKNVKTDKKLVIAGGSSDTDSFMEELKDLAKGDDRILFTGFVQGAMLDELYSNAYIYTLPSDLEGMPLSLLEAMSYGNCCLVSDIPECAEVVEDKALIFQKSNVEDLQEKLQDACDHPEMVMEMKKHAADFICKKYNWDDVVEETMKLYRRK